MSPIGRPCGCLGEPGNPCQSFKPCRGPQVLVHPPRELRMPCCSGGCGPARRVLSRLSSSATIRRCSPTAATCSATSRKPRTPCSRRSSEPTEHCSRIRRRASCARGCTRSRATAVCRRSRPDARSSSSRTVCRRSSGSLSRCASGRICASWSRTSAACRRISAQRCCWPSSTISHTSRSPGSWGAR